MSVVQKSQVLTQLLTIHLLGLLPFLHKPIIEYTEQPLDLSKQSLSAISDTLDRGMAQYELSTSYVLWVVLLYLFVVMTAVFDVDRVLSLLRIAGKFYICNIYSELLQSLFIFSKYYVELATE